MFLEKSKNRILKGFDDFCRELPGVSGEILKMLEHVGDREALAMKYLYANMPYSDVGNYSFDTIWDYAAHGVFLWENSPYRDRMTEEMFLSDVLYHRVNEEEIKPCRSFFWNQIKELVRGRSMLEAVLELNYWCASEVTYQATDDRTSSAIDTYRCGFGRCGEESVFAVNVLRSAGIPARQVYVPKWSHCDDNHAWVEVWCDGTWHYIGACEPEAVPDRGWFTNAASRAMLVRSRCFERPAGPVGAGTGPDESAGARAEKRPDMAEPDGSGGVEAEKMPGMAERNGSGADSKKMPEMTDLDGGDAGAEKMAGMTEEADRFICREGIDVILNQLDRYARTRKITVQVTDTEGRAVPDAVVSMEVLNYAEFSPIASIKADQNGYVSFVTGLGSLHIAACADGKYGECMADTRLADHFCCVIGTEPVWDTWTDFDMAAPEETTNWGRQDGRVSDYSAQRSRELQCETPWAGEKCMRCAERSKSWVKNETQRKENDVRLTSPEQEEENDRRTEEAAKQCRIKRAQFKPEWEVYFSRHGEEEPSAKTGEADRSVPENVRKLLWVLTPKDRRDVSPEVLLEHCGEVSAGRQSSSGQCRMERDLSERCGETLSCRGGLPYENTCSEAGNCCRETYPGELFLPYVCSPRIENEVLTPWRRYILHFFTLEQQEAFRRTPEQIWAWIREHIVSRDDRERLSIYTTPAAALKLGIAGEASQKILFVAIARTLGIPSRLNPADGEMEYWQGNSFVPALSERRKTARLVITACEEDTSWIYFQNWSIAKMELSGYRSLSLQKLSWESEKNTVAETGRSEKKAVAEAGKSEKKAVAETEGSEKNAAVKPGKSVIDLEPGRYRVLTANRLPTGDILARRYEFCLKKGQKKELELGLRKASLGDMLSSHNISSYYVRSREGAELSLSELTRGERKILFWLDPGKEPTEHVLNELLERRQDFVGRQEQLLFLLPGSAALENDTFALCRKAFPGVKIFFDAFGKGMEMAARSMYVDPGKRPLLIVTEGEVHGIFAASGYSVGIVDMLLRILFSH